MRRSTVAVWVVFFVVVNAAMVWYVRDRMSRPPESVGASQPAAPASTPSAEPEIRGRVFLSGAPDGAVLRVTPGGCRADDSPVEGWIAPPGGAPESVELPPVSAVASVDRSGDSWRIIGGDADCEVTAWTSRSLTGGRWSETAIPAAAWYLDPEDATQVYSPRGRLALPGGCSASGIQAADAKIYLVCDDGRVMVADQGVREFTGLSANGEVVAVAADAEGRVAQLMSSPGCLALVRVSENQKITGQHCFDAGKAPLGVAWAGDEPVAQIGFDLMDSSGGRWAPRS